MKITKRDFWPVVLIAFVLAVGVYLMPQLPDKIPSHWNFEGKIDGYMSKGLAIYFFPALTFLIYVLFLVLPYLDPLKKNYDEFKKQYYWFRICFVIFLLSLYIFTLITALGYVININYFILPLMSFGMILMGLFLPKVKRNYFVGFKLPWTLHSDANWDQTHKFAGKTFVWAGFIALISLGFLKENNASLMVILCIVAAGIIPIIQSYLFFRKYNDGISNS